MLIIRRHRIFLQLKILPLFFILFLFLSLIIFFLFKKISLPIFIETVFPQIESSKLNYFLVFIFSLILPIIYSAIIFEICRYYLTYWIITNRRIISANLIGFFNYKYENIEIDKIQDVTIYIKGVLSSFFHFGTIRIQTAGEQGQFLLSQIPNPEIVKQIIFEVRMDILKK